MVCLLLVAAISRQLKPRSHDICINLYTFLLVASIICMQHCCKCVPVFFFVMIFFFHSIHSFSFSLFSYVFVFILNGNVLFVSFSLGDDFFDGNEVSSNELVRKYISE